MLRRLLKALLEILRFALAAGMGVGFFIWLRMVGDHYDSGTLTLRQFWLAMLGAGLMHVLVIVVHEAGHWFSGRAQGFIGVRFVVLWLQIERHGPRWTVKLARRPAKLGGMVVQYPSSGQRLRQRKFWSVAAGPGANLITGAPALLAGAALLPPVGSYQAAGPVLLASQLLVFALFSLTMGLINLIPKKVTPELSNDGLLLWHLWRREPTLSRQLAVTALVGSSFAGLRPRDWDSTLVVDALAPKIESVVDCSAFLLAYSHHLDAHRFEQARTLLHACLDHLRLLPEASQQQVYCEAAYFEARYAANPAQAQHWLECAQQVKPFEADKYEGDFTQAIVAWAHGQYDAALLHFRRAEAGPTVENENDAGSHVLALERMADLRTRLAAPAG